MGRASERSDIDVAITGPEPVDPVVMAEVREACEALPTLYTVDLVDLGMATTSVREVALAHGVAMEPV